jgi:hypothetical protein
LEFLRNSAGTDSSLPKRLEALDTEMKNLRKLIEELQKSLPTIIEQRQK